MSQTISIPQDLYQAAIIRAKELNEYRIVRKRIATEEFDISKEKCQTPPITWQQVIRAQARAAFQFDGTGLHDTELSEQCLNILIRSAKYYI